MATAKSLGDLPFGIVAVENDNVPEPPRKHDRDDERWDFVKNLLVAHVGQWFNVKTYDNISAAGIKASNINGGKDKRFPNTEYVARYTRNKESKTSDLYLQKHS